MKTSRVSDRSSFHLQWPVPGDQCATAVTLNSTHVCWQQFLVVEVINLCDTTVASLGTRQPRNVLVVIGKVVRQPQRNSEQAGTLWG